MSHEVQGLRLPHRPNAPIFLTQYREANVDNVVRGDYYQLSYDGPRAILFYNPEEQRVNLWREDGVDLTDKTSTGQALSHIELDENLVLDGILIHDFIFDGEAFGIYDIMPLCDGLVKLPFVKRVTMLTTLMIVFGRNPRLPLRRIPINFFSGDLRKLIKKLYIEQEFRSGILDGAIFHTKNDTYDFELNGPSSSIRKFKFPSF